MGHQSADRYSFILFHRLIINTTVIYTMQKPLRHIFFCKLSYEFTADNSTLIQSLLTNEIMISTSTGNNCRNSNHFGCTLQFRVWSEHQDVWMPLQLCFAAQKKKQFYTSLVLSFHTQHPLSSKGQNQAPEEWWCCWRDVVSSVIQTTSSRKLPNLTRQQLACSLPALRTQRRSLSEQGIHTPFKVYLCLSF